MPLLYLAWLLRSVAPGEQPVELRGDLVEPRGRRTLVPAEPGLALLAQKRLDGRAQGLDLPALLLQRVDDVAVAEPEQPSTEDEDGARRGYASSSSLRPVSAATALAASTSAPVKPRLSP